MPKKKGPIELALDRVMRALDELPADRRLDVLLLVRHLVERDGAGGRAPKERKNKAPLPGAADF